VTELARHSRASKAPKYIGQRVKRIYSILSSTLPRTSLVEAGADVWHEQASQTLASARCTFVVGTIMEARASGSNR
jgi:hypothetical protein